MKMKKFKSLLLLALPLFAMALSSCVKYNGKGSSNPVDPPSPGGDVTLTISKETASRE